MTKTFLFVPHPGFAFSATKKYLIGHLGHLAKAIIHFVGLFLPLKYSVTHALIMILVIFNHYYENLCNIIVTLNVRLDLLPPSTKPTRTKSPAMTSAVFALN